MSRGEAWHMRVMRRFPRVSGDEPCDTVTHEAGVVFSPRERG